VKPSELNVLTALRRARRGMTERELVEATGHDQPTVNRARRALEEQGLVYRCRVLKSPGAPSVWKAAS